MHKGGYAITLPRRKRRRTSGKREERNRYMDNTVKRGSSLGYNDGSMGVLVPKAPSDGI